MNEQHRLDELQTIMTDLFDLRRGTGMYRNCVEFKCLSGRGSDWKAFPGTYPFLNTRGERVESKKPAREGYRRLCAYLGKQKRFSVAASPRQFKDTRWMSGEWDFDDLPVPPDESTLKYLLNEDLYQLVSQELTIHWRFSGNRSIYFDTFTTGRIKMKTAHRLMVCLQHLLTSGKFDRSNLDQCLRLPLSRHYDNDALCRYQGCHTLGEVLGYLQHIERDHTDDRQVNRHCHKLEAFLGIKKPRKPCIKHKAGTPICSSQSHSGLSVNTLGIGSLVTLQDQWIQRLGSIPYLVNHSRREEFLTYLQYGIPEGSFNQVIFAGDYEFQKFVVLMTGVKDEAHEFLRQLACMNLQDRRRIKNRLGRVDYVFRNYFTSWQDCDASYVAPGKLKSFDWLEPFVDKMRHEAYDQIKDRRAVNNMIQVMQYCLLLLYRHPEGATIAVADVQRKVKISHQTAVTHLNRLKKEFPLLTVKTGHSRKDRLATDYVLNEAYVESVLGYSIRDDLAPAA